MRMVPRLTWAAAALVVALVAARSAPAQEAPRPRAVFEETRAEWGVIIQGDKTAHRFRVRNTGNANLEILRTEEGCHCTASIVDSNLIPPGGTGEIEVRFDSAGRLGFQVAQVAVYTNDLAVNPDGSGIVRLEYSGEVTTVFQALPATVYFETVERRAGAEQEMKLQIREAWKGSDWKVLRIETPRYVEAEHRREGAVVKIKVRFLPGAPLGDFRQDLVIHTDHPKQPRMTVPVIADVVGRILVFPREVLSRRIDKAAPSLPTITLLFRPESKVPKGEIIEILEQRLSSGAFRVKRTYMDEGRKVQFELVVLPDAKPGAVSDTLVLGLNDPDMPEVRIPILGEIIGRVKVEPPAIWFGKVKTSEGAEASVEVYGPVGNYEVKENMEGGGTIVERRADGSFTLKVALPRFESGAPQPGPFSKRVVLRGDVPGEEEIVIPVRGVYE